MAHPNRRSVALWRQRRLVEAGYTASVSPSAVERILAAAEIWRSGADPAGGPVGSMAGTPHRSSSEPGPVAARLVVGWEAAYPFCAAICSTAAGLDFCRRCPEVVVASVLATRRPAGGTCGAGVRLLAFPVPTDDRRSAEVVVLRVGHPTARQVAKMGSIAHVPPASLRRAAHESPPSRGGDVLRAAHRLRSAAGRLEWQVVERERSADRQRAASATLAQFIVATEEFQALYRSADRQRRELQRARDTADRLAREAVRVRQREHARIAHQIHDTAAQSMVSAVRFLDAAVSELRAWEASRSHQAGQSEAGQAVRHGADKGGLALVAGHLDLAQERLRAAIHEIRMTLDELTPAGLEQGLDQAVRFRHRDLLVETGLNGSVQGTLPRLEPWVEQVVYGMVTEAMTNAARHSGGQSLSVDCSTVRDRVVIVVRDDGIGTSGWGDRSAARRRGGGGGLGIAGLVRQTRWLGGTVAFRDRSGGGTAVRISVPLSRHLPKRPGADDGPVETSA
ncbi:MAG: hypothetical protein C0498_04995 [Anaerolinea sp.]|nr:hypothetical protein [Anaerolinea sp.]